VVRLRALTGALVEPSLATRTSASNALTASTNLAAGRHAVDLVIYRERDLDVGSDRWCGGSGSGSLEPT